MVALYLLTRPVVDRRLSSGRAAMGRRAAELRARDIVRRHGTGTLDYFALRDDKQWFFHRDSLVAYAVFGGVCLVSPDPIGPFSERAHVWDSFRRYVDRNGWGLGVMGAGEEWLPTYQASGMRFLYIGDEAVVDPREFSLAGRQDEGAAPGGQPRRPLRLHRPLPRPGPARSRPTPPAWPSSWPRAAAASRSAASP